MMAALRVKHSRFSRRDKTVTEGYRYCVELLDEIERIMTRDAKLRSELENIISIQRREVRVGRYEC